MKNKCFHSFLSFLAGRSDRLELESLSPYIRPPFHYGLYALEVRFTIPSSDYRRLTAILILLCGSIKSVRDLHVPLRRAACAVVVGFYLRLDKVCLYLRPVFSFCEPKCNRLLCPLNVLKPGTRLLKNATGSTDQDICTRRYHFGDILKTHVAVHLNR